MKRSEIILWALVGLMAVAVAGVGGWRWLAPSGEAPTLATAVADPGCDLHRAACSARLENGGTALLSIEPRPIRPVEPLSVRVALGGIEAERVELDFAGVEMNMGFNRFPLEAAATGEFTGAAMLPVCVRNRMLWEVQVLAFTDEGVYRFPFRFDTVQQ